HGTAIISAAGLLNALELNGKKIDTIRVVVNGAGAAAISCARLYKALGVKKENMIMCDSKGVIYTGRAGLNAEKEEFAVETSARTLTEALVGADMFLGLSVADILNEEMIQSMAKDPIVFALANPNPEISYEKAIHSRPDIIFATGRSDYPNQINNVLGFPYIFRGALDVQARSINEEMKLAATYALAELTKEPVPENVKMAYNDPSIAFGRNYIIPKPLDTRLISRIAPAVAKAAIESGVARTEIEDWDAYRDQLEKRMGQDERLMRRMTRKAKTNPKRIVFAEGADIKTLMAVQEILSEKIAHPILIGNKTEIETLQKQYKLELPELTIFDPTKEIDKIDQYTQAYYEKRQRKGIILEQAKELMKNPNFIGLMMVESGEADGFISGIHSNYHDVLRAAKDIIGLRACCKYAVGMHIVTNKKGTYFLADTTVNSHPSADTLECVTVLTYEAVKQFNVEPVVALTSYSNFGEYRLGSPAQIQEAVDTLHRKYPEILVDGEMSASIAFNTELRQARFPFSPLANKDVNTIIFPNLSSGSIALGILQELGNNEIIGPVLLGLNKPVHILQMGCSVRDIVYMTTLAVTDAQKEMPVDMCRI
ncbi:MAG: phosphate acyltransferase, partial [Butyricimonas virosa]|nr:phosphate acyltransferase [Butyricimonas virosa]